MHVLVAKIEAKKTKQRNKELENKKKEYERRKAAAAAAREAQKQAEEEEHDDDDETPDFGQLENLYFAYMLLMS